MSVVLAAIDNSASARPVLDFARELARVFGAEVEVVHVEANGTPRTASENAHALHLPFHRRLGDVATAITATAKERDAIAVVLGTRGTPSGASPAGHVTIDLIRSLEIPVAVVPPSAKLRPVSRVLVAVEGDGESHVLRHLSRHLRHRPDLEMIALHVFTPDRLPMFGDQPVRETEAWKEEFGRRSLRTDERDVRLEVRVGDAAQVVRQMAQELDVDLVGLAWHRDLAHGHGRLVNSMLAESDVPVLLLPIT